MKAEGALRWVNVSVAALVTVLVVTQVIGVRGRVFLPEQKVYTVATAADCYDALQEAGVKGRILVVLDQRARIVPRTWMATFMESLTDASIEPPVMTHNLTSSLVYAGIAREVYFVPPDGLWQLELERAMNRPDSLPEGNGIRTRFYGAPIHTYRSADLPVIAEKVVVYIAEPVSDRYDPHFLETLTDPRVADVVVRQVAP